MLPEEQVDPTGGILPYAGLDEAETGNVTVGGGFVALRQPGSLGEIAAYFGGQQDEG